MGFDYQSFLNDKIFEELNKIKAFSPEVIEQEAAARKKPGFPHDKLVFAAADHNARMINEYKGNPIGLSNRREYLSRLVRMLQSDQIDGIEATPDIIEDLFILNKLQRERGEKAFLDGKMLVGTVNRGGLKNMGDGRYAVLLYSRSPSETSDGRCKVYDPSESDG